MKIVDTKDTMSQIYLDAVKIRHQVFVNEQGVPLEIEIDKDEAYAIHFVLYTDENEPAATVRLLPLKNGLVKVQRMAVLAKYRGLHYGEHVLEAAEDFARKQHFSELVLGGQLTAVPFYQKLGYETYGPEFREAGIQHLHMRKKV